MKEDDIRFNVLFKLSKDGDFIVVSAQFEKQYAYIKIKDDPDIDEEQKNLILRRVENTLAERVKKDYRATLIS